MMTCGGGSLDGGICTNNARKRSFSSTLLGEISEGSDCYFSHRKNALHGAMVFQMDTG